MHKGLMALALAALGLAAGCQGDRPEGGAGRQARGDRAAAGTGVPSAGDAVTDLEQGWAPAVRARGREAGFGSRMLPYPWLRHLEQAGRREPFLAPAHLQSLGFLLQAPSAGNPDGLPVGMTLSRPTRRQGEAWAGLGCAACHTGELRHGDHRIRVDGGQGWLDFTAFERAVIDSLSATAQDPAVFARFADALETPANRRESLRAALIERASVLEARHRINASDVAYGPGRLDAFGQIFNTVAVDVLGIPGNRRSPDAPVSYPVLWSAPHLDLVQWNGSAPNAGPGPLIQNVTTALAVYGHAQVPSRGPGYASDIDFRQLGRLQDDLYHLTAPAWPASILGALDPARVARGKPVYAAHCASCHEPIDARDPRRRPRAVLTPLADVGTDPRMVRNFLDADARTGPLQGRKALVVAGAPFGERARSIDLVAHVAIGVALRHPLSSVRDAVKGHHRVAKAALDTHPDYYKARPLDGVWASAPYLHNGSVPTLEALLRPAAERPATFQVGRGEFDPVAVGLATPADGGWTFDTRVPGNLNSGHEYGTGLDEAQRRDLLEYLKSL